MAAPETRNITESRLDSLLRTLMELVVLALVVVSPWFFGAVEFAHRRWMYLGLSILLLLWAVRVVSQWRVTWIACPVAGCLSILFLFGVLQVSPSPSLMSLASGQTEMYGRLLPEQHEVISATPLADSVDEAGRTLSLYPTVTRDWLVSLLAVFVLFVLVRNNTASPAALRRLSIAVLINGAALSLFGLIQFFSSPDVGTVYWTFPTEGEVFGPFINRNHFAFYVNIGIGLGIGVLLLARQNHSPRAPQDWHMGIRDLLNAPTLLWVAGGLALMLSGIVFSVSRGGFLALLGAAVVCALVMRRTQRSWGLGVFTIGALALGLSIWFGFDRVEARLSTLWTGEAYRTDQGRVFLLYRAAPVLREFPLFGTGSGTFRFIEPLWFHTAANVGTLYRHAHNDYLEDLIEGGLVRLSLRLIAILIVLRLAWRAVRHGSKQGQVLALAASFSFVTVVIHSFFDFGLQIPAIAALATVVVAHLCDLGERAELADAGPTAKTLPKKGRGKAADSVNPRSMAFGGAAPGVAGAAAVLLAGYLYAEGTRYATVDRLRNEALAMRELAFTGDFTRAREIPFLQEALRLRPHDAELHFMLAEAYLAVDAELRQATGKPQDEQENVISAIALQHILAARDLCPLLPAAHARLAAHRDHLSTADSRANYMARAKFLAPADPQLWYLCGLQEMSEGGKLEQARASWRRSLELSDQHLADILDRIAIALDADAILELLPKKPELLLKAAFHLFPQDDTTELRQPYLITAKSLLDQQDRASYDAQDWYTKAVVLRELGQADEAIECYRRALTTEAQNVAWRYQLAVLLSEQSLYPEARRQLEMILDRRPGYSAARRLFDSIRRKEAEQQ